jgi:hypothetical protein
MYGGSRIERGLTHRNWRRSTCAECICVAALGKSECPLWVGSTHCRLAASGKPNSTGRFPAMNLESGPTQPDPLLPLSQPFQMPQPRRKAVVRRLDCERLPCPVRSGCTLQGPGVMAVYLLIVRDADFLHAYRPEKQELSWVIVSPLVHIPRVLSSLWKSAKVLSPFDE